MFRYCASIVTVLLLSSEGLGHGEFVHEVPAGSEFSVSNMEVMSHLPVTELGGDEALTSEEFDDRLLVSDLWGWTDPETGDEYALVERSDSTAFVRVTDPRRPVYLGSLPSESWNSPLRDIKTFGNHAYIVADDTGTGDALHGMQIFDLTRLRGLTEAPAEHWTADAIYNGFNGAHNVAINPDSGLLLATPPGFEARAPLLDVTTDPLNPKRVGEYRLNIHDAQVITYNGPDERYVGEEVVFMYNGPNGALIASVEGEPGTRLIGRLPEYPDAVFTHQGWVTADHRFVLVGDESDEKRFDGNTRTFIYNIETLSAPVYLGAFEHEAQATDHNLYIEGDYAYLANYNSGMRVLDLADIENGNLKEVASIDTHPDDDTTGLYGAWSTYPFFESGNVLLSDTHRGLIVARLAVNDFPGDFDGDGDLDELDVDALIWSIDEGRSDPRFDLNADDLIDAADLQFWVSNIFQTTAGDANLSGEFTTRDLLAVFTANEYQDDLENNSHWVTGDWNGDREFDSSDLVAAFADGGYRPDINEPVPEPATPNVWFIAAAAIVIGRVSPPHTRPLSHDSRPPQ